MRPKALTFLVASIMVISLLAGCRMGKETPQTPGDAQASYIRFVAKDAESYMQRF